MSANSRLQPPSRNRSSVIFGISLLIGLVLLFGIASLFWLAQNRLLVLGPTPTPTATPALLFTATPDFGATRVQEDLLTQTAYHKSELGTPTGDNQSYLPQVSAGDTNTPESIAGA